MTRSVPVLLLGVLVGGAAGWGAILLAATRSGRPAVFLGIGMVLAGAVAAGTTALVRRGRPAGRRWLEGLAGAGAVALLAAGTLVPLPDRPAADPAGLRFWDLGTGSRLAYLSAPATGRAAHQPWPVVVLHGGPGVPDLAHDRSVWGRLADDGFDVYVYAQLGAGPSSRLADPTGYSRDRDVADLEAVRRTLGVDRMVLVGHSYGGTLAAAYLADHPDRVAALVLSSPGPLDPADHSGDRATTRLSATQRLRLHPALHPRALLGYLLLQVDPAAAHAYLPDQEADARNDTLLRRAAPALYCRAPVDASTEGSGFYRLQYPQSRTAPPAADLRPRLAGLPVRALVVKGGCDYQSWTSAADFRDLLPRARLVYLPQVGHNTYLEDPDTVLATARAFLADRPLPVPPYREPGPPPDYQHR